MDRIQQTLARARAERTWQFLLLAVTSVILSIASGWTTWIGMQNFTDEYVLSLMITFGIQGVMLVLAWHLGVRLAEGGADASSLPSQIGARRIVPALSRFLEVLAILALAAILLYVIFKYIFREHPVVELPDWPVFQYTTAALAVAAVGILGLRLGSHLASHFVFVFQFILRNLVPILMIILCLAASVFFSFDALFSKIVPDEERRRLADLRSKTDVAAIVNKMQDKTTQLRKTAASDFLWGEQWLTFESKLKDVRVALNGVPKTAAERIEELRKRALAQRQKDEKALADLESARTEVNGERERLATRLQQEQTRATQLSTELTKLDETVFEIERRIVEKIAEADAEARGIGDTSVRGRGPHFRRLSDEISRLQEEKANVEVRRDGYRQRSAQIVAAVSDLEKGIASLSTRIERFDNRLRQQRAKPQSRPESLSIESVRAQVKQHDADLEGGRLKFEQSPTRGNLDSLQNQCAKAAGFVRSFASPTNVIDSNACSTASVQLAAARLFTLNEASSALAQKCVGNNAALTNTTVEARLSFVRDCLNLSSLLPLEAKGITADINALERERDDQAHRFVVTFNAFRDGNKLAFLALGIAAAIDVLVLASGFLGATAMRSSLAGRGLRNDMPTSERELMIETALMPDVAGNARRVIAEFNPIAKRAHGADSHWTHELVVDRASDSSLRAVLRRLVNSGLMIGAVVGDQKRSGTYLVNVSLIEYLIKLARASDTDEQSEQEFIPALARALGEPQAERAKALLEYFIPTNRVAGYSSRIDLPSVAIDDREIVRRCLNVASAFGFVADSEKRNAELDIHVSAEFYLALLDMSAAAGGGERSSDKEGLPQSTGHADAPTAPGTQEIETRSRQNPPPPAPGPASQSSLHDGTTPEAAPHERGRFGPRPDHSATERVHTDLGDRIKLHCVRTTGDPTSGTAQDRGPRVSISNGKISFD